MEWEIFISQLRLCEDWFLSAADLFGPPQVLARPRARSPLLSSRLSLASLPFPSSPPRARPPTTGSASWKEVHADGQRAWRQAPLRRSPNARLRGLPLRFFRAIHRADDDWADIDQPDAPSQRRMDPETAAPANRLWLVGLRSSQGPWTSPSPGPDLLEDLYSYEFIKAKRT